MFVFFFFCFSWFDAADVAALALIPCAVSSLYVPSLGINIIHPMDGLVGEQKALTINEQKLKQNNRHPTDTWSFSRDRSTYSMPYYYCFEFGFI